MPQIFHALPPPGSLNYTGPSPDPMGMSPVQSSPQYQQVTSIPGWLPRERTQELEDQYRNTNARFDTSAYDAGNRAQQSRTLTSASNSANAAAAEYANRARQAGGSGLGAGLVRAQAVTGAREIAGKMELERLQHDSEQREHAANYAATIANQLSTIRNQYLQSIVNYATTTDRTNADFVSTQHRTDTEAATAAARLAAEHPRVNTGGIGGWTVGTGLGRGSSQFTFGSWQDALSYSDSHPQGSPFLGLGGYGG
jgi:hypothetical protein